MKQTKKGFTLIELLIVVAIIAILAAIAIPNFLAAQVRAKVSRAKAELKTLTTALESYRIDNNEYPFDFVDGTMAAPGWPYYVGNGVTSPISYVSSNKIEDPFALVNANVDPSADRVARRYRYVNWSEAGSYHAIYPEGTVSDGLWRLYSVGPDGGPEIAIEYYDPTNGTVSNGDIFRTQKYGSGRAGIEQ